MIRDQSSRDALAATNRHMGWRRTRRAWKQALRGVMPLYNKGVRIGTASPVAETVRRRNRPSQ
jgi:hypothetical protein